MLLHLIGGRQSEPAQIIACSNQMGGVKKISNCRLLEPIGNIRPAETEQRYHEAVCAQ